MGVGVGWGGGRRLEGGRECRPDPIKYPSNPREQLIDFENGIIPLSLDLTPSPDNLGVFSRGGLEF